MWQLQAGDVWRGRVAETSKGSGNLEGGMVRMRMAMGIIWQESGMGIISGWLAGNEGMTANLDPRSINSSFPYDGNLQVHSDSLSNSKFIRIMRPSG